MRGESVDSKELRIAFVALTCARRRACMLALPSDSADDLIEVVCGVGFELPAQ